MSTTLPELGSSITRRPAPPITRVSSALARRAQWYVFTAALVITDFALVGLAFRLAHYLRFDLALSIFQSDIGERGSFYAMLVAALVLVWMTAFAAIGLYDRQNLLGGTDEYARIFRASTYCLLFVVVLSFLNPRVVIARGWLLLAWLLAFVFVALGRFALRRTVYYLRQHGLFLSTAVIVGANREGVALAQQLQGWHTSGLEVAGFIDNKLPAGTPVSPSLSVLGSVEQLQAIVHERAVEEIILASSAVSVRDHLLAIYQNYGFAKGTNLRLSSGLYEIITTGLNVREFAYVPLVGINKLRLAGFDQLLKLVLDYAIVIPGLILAAPVLGLIALAIRLDSPGPILYQRHVMGVNGSRFGAYKFRTMVANGDAVLAARPDLRAELACTHKLKSDPRVTRVGRLLRRTSLDELPQVFNVLRREMSLVGPRMIAPDEMAKYDQWAHNLLTVKPGITGLWQVSGRSNISYQERVQLDMHYIRNWSIWLDLQLLWQTIPAVIRGTGAY